MDSTNSPERSFISVCKEFFGFKPGQSLSEFSAEIKELTPRDRVEITQGLRQNGFNVKAE